MKLIPILFLLFFISGCNQLNIQPGADSSLEDVVSLQQQADTAYKAQDWATAEKHYRQLTEKVPGQIEPWFRLGNIYARTERLDAAVVAYRNALVRDSENSKIWHNLGVVHLRQATTTFVDMLDNTPPGDPLNERARHVVNSVTELLSSGFGAADE